MSIDYGCHCRLPIPEAQKRIAYMRRSQPDWYGGIFHLTDAALGRFDREIGEAFGIETNSHFSLHLLNKDWLEESREAVEFVYQVFGTDNVVVTYGNDSIRPPLQRNEPMKIE